MFKEVYYNVRKVTAALHVVILIKYAEFHSLGLLNLDCLFKFSLESTVEKCVEFIDFLVVRYKLMTTEMFLEDWKELKNRMGRDLASTVDDVTVH